MVHPFANAFAVLLDALISICDACHACPLESRALHLCRTAAMVRSASCVAWPMTRCAPLPAWCRSGAFDAVKAFKRTLICCVVKLCSCTLMAPRYACHMVLASAKVVKRFLHKRQHMRHCRHGFFRFDSELVRQRDAQACRCRGSLSTCCHAIHPGMR